MSELVVPSNSDLSTIIVPPCTMGGSKSQQSKSSTLPASTKKKSATAPPCTAPAPAPPSQ